MGGELELVDGDARVGIVPERGGLVARFDVGGRAVLFLDEETLRDPAKNVRGGIPVLYPTPGKLTGDAWRWSSETGALKQHGFARNRPWQVTASSPRTAFRRVVTSSFSKRASGRGESFRRAKATAFSSSSARTAFA